MSLATRSADLLDVLIARRGLEVEAARQAASAVRRSARARFERRRFHPPYLRLVDPHGRWPDLPLQQVPDGKLDEARTAYSSLMR